MRLIDADKLKRNIEKEMCKIEENTPMYLTLECVLADIDNQPTVSGTEETTGGIIEDSALLSEYKKLFRE